MMCGWILHTTAWRTLVAVYCLQQQSDGQAWLSTWGSHNHEQWAGTRLLIQVLDTRYPPRFWVKNVAYGACLVLAPVTDQVELTVRRLLALASTSCGASCMLEMYSVSWCSGEKWKDGLINHHFPWTVHLNQESRQISASGYIQPLFSSLFDIMLINCA